MSCSHESTAGGSWCAFQNIGRIFFAFLYWSMPAAGFIDQTADVVPWASSNPRVSRKTIVSGPCLITRQLRVRRRSGRSLPRSAFYPRGIRCRLYGCANTASGHVVLERHASSGRTVCARTRWVFGKLAPHRFVRYRPLTYEAGKCCVPPDDVTAVRSWFLPVMMSIKVVLARPLGAITARSFGASSDLDRQVV